LNFKNARIEALLRFRALKLPHKKKLSTYACEAGIDIRAKADATGAIVGYVFCLSCQNWRLQSLISVSVDSDKCLSNSASAVVGSPEADDRW